MAIRGYYLGCPGWGVKTWVGRLFPSSTRPTEFLERYARVFNTVEGNTTFYALPAAEIRRRFIDFFAERGHTVVPSASLVPAGDATLLFVNSGMVPFKDALTGAEKRSYTRAVNFQRPPR